MENYSATRPLHCARNTASYYYDAKTHLPDLNCFTWNIPITISGLSPIGYSTLLVCVTYMSRIGEILSLKVKNVIHPDRAICYGSKRSNGYVLLLPGLSKQIEKWIYRTAETPLFPISYSRLYRECVRSGIFFNDGGSGNIPKLHAHRYLFARKEIDAIGAQGVKTGLHHKSITSQSYYLQKGKNCHE